MGAALLPAAAGLFASGLFAWTAVDGLWPAWPWLATGAAGLAATLIAMTRPAPAPLDPLGAGPVPDADDPAAVLDEIAGPAVGSVLPLVPAFVGLFLLGVGWAGLWDARLDDGVLLRAAPTSGRFEAALRTDPTVGTYGWSAIADIAVIDTRAGPVTVRWFQLMPACPGCGLRLDRGESDYFLGAIVFNMAFAEGLFAVGVFGVLLWTYPSPPWDALYYGGIAGMIAAPIVLYPYSKLFWLAFDLGFRPPGPEDFAPRPTG